LGQRAWQRLWQPSGIDLPIQFQNKIEWARAPIPFLPSYFLTRTKLCIRFQPSSPHSSTMPKRPNAHRLAAQAVRLSDSLSSALSGKYEVGLLEAALGHSSFRVRLSGSVTRVVSITSAVLRGGKTSPARVERGHYLIVSGSEVVGVVNKKADYKALQKAGRIPDVALDGETGCLDDLFEVDRSASEENDIWANKDEERIAEASTLERRIRRRRAGLAVADKSALKIDGEEDASEPVEEEEAVAAPVAAAEEPSTPTEELPSGKRQITSQRRLRAMALAAAAANAPSAAEVEEAERVAAYWAQVREQEVRAAELEALSRRAADQDWEALIDAI
jgi:hypothetical protein